MADKSKKIISKIDFLKMEQELSGKAFPFVLYPTIYDKVFLCFDQDSQLLEISSDGTYLIRKAEVYIKFMDKNSISVTYNGLTVILSIESSEN